MLPELVTEIPGPRSRELAHQLRAYESRNVTYISPHFPVFWQRAAGANVWDVDDNRFLDLTSGFGVASLGFTPAPVVEAAREQLGRLYHAMGDVHPTEEKVALCARLSELTFESWDLGDGKTILTNSGSEAVEAALKTAATTAWDTVRSLSRAAIFSASHSPSSSPILRPSCPFPMRRKRQAWKPSCARPRRFSRTAKSARSWSSRCRAAAARSCRPVGFCPSCARWPTASARC
jgi:hypothetical protein